MFSFSPTAEVYLHRLLIDFGKRIDGLAVIVQASMVLDPMREALPVLTNRRANGVLVLWWDRNGFCLWMKRLEEHRFVWPTQSKAGRERVHQLLRGAWQRAPACPVPSGARMELAS
jgi:transposase